MEEQVKNSAENDLVHSFDSAKSSFLTPRLVAIISVVIILGIGSGYFLSKNQSGPISAIQNGANNSASIGKGATFGSDDTKTFKDIAEGTLVEGGIEGEGQFHLKRPGGESQNVYMTSSIVDLSKFIDKKIKVWGETQKAQHAGWLMDVGRVEVL